MFSKVFSVFGKEIRTSTSYLSDTSSNGHYIAIFNCVKRQGNVKVPENRSMVDTENVGNRDSSHDLDNPTHGAQQQCWLFQGELGPAGMAYRGV